MATIETILKRLEYHDWYYGWSDYAETDRRGREAEQCLIKDIMQLPDDRQRTLLMDFMNKYKGGMNQPRTSDINKLAEQLNPKQEPEPAEQHVSLLARILKKWNNAGR